MVTMKLKTRILNFNVGVLPIDPVGCEVPESVPVAFGAIFNFFDGTGTMATLTKTPTGVDAEFEVGMAVVNEISNPQKKLWALPGGVLLEKIGTKVTKSKIFAVVIDRTNTQDLSLDPLKPDQYISTLPQFMINR